MPERPAGRRSVSARSIVTTRCNPNGNLRSDCAPPRRIVARDAMGRPVCLGSLKHLLKPNVGFDDRPRPHRQGPLIGSIAAPCDISVSATFREADISLRFSPRPGFSRAPPTSFPLEEETVLTPISSRKRGYTRNALASGIPGEVRAQLVSPSITQRRLSGTFIISWRFNFLLDDPSPPVIIIHQREICGAPILQWAICGATQPDLHDLRGRPVVPAALMSGGAPRPKSLGATRLGGQTARWK
jgi:hypothetical protein